ncbi:low affinity immunoglobulin gamma Fc region receptor II-a-like [Siniperca chuatsi]|uniref:low affinity immunoglobulin gamma Fc region receptor II-a-like n=1 Tax=Siniperca chuatsi TaxID=119488 RepID=UPI001CE1546D|nr:low affinity immunoglobulin gamma Fc region receptor II-a-like [Siniperca chuatsi]XP_044040163.1 low affinity immunoglobulin gamma Fc region receptor II-a-like [Siniperca chuatsi]
MAKALCIRLLMTVLMLLVVQLSYPQTSVSDAAVRIVPTRLQLFEYNSVHFTCEGFNVSAGWKVRNIKEFIPECSKCTVTTTVTYAIDYALASDSGEYWCEGGGGERSNTVSITVTAGSVILESPALPVMEGDAVTLNCRERETSPNLTADFYKDGLLIGTSSTGHMTIHSVSKSDEGLYKCRISGAGESPGSRLSVRASDKEINFSRHYYFRLWIRVTVILVLQLLVMGLLYWKKQLQLHTVLLQAKVNEPNKDMYAVVKKGKKKKDAADAADNLSLCLDTNHSPTPQTEKGSGVSSFTVTSAPSAATDPTLTDQYHQYASTQEVAE